jgi:ribosomal protein S18 acetylase RimI-like enzyme
MKFMIRDVTPNDVPIITALMRDFAEFEELTAYFEATADQLAAVMFGEQAFVNGLVDEENGEVIAYALFYPNYATFRGQRGMYLEDLYISPAHRGNGIGEAIIRKIAQVAKAQGCKRIDFQVLEWNQPAIGFYKRLGADREDTERHFKFTDAAFEELSK